MSAGTAGIAPGAVPRALVMSDVAARAGVSHQTVSRVVNGHPNVAPSTRERVQRAIEELGYRPNSAARTLVTGSSRTLGLVSVNLAQYGPAQALVGLEAAARDAGYALSIAVLEDVTEQAVAAAVGRLVDQSVDVVVVHSTHLATAEALDRIELSTPLVTVQGPPDGARPTVWVDQAVGARLVVEHLLALGHRTVHHVAGPGYSLEADRRVAGWEDCLQAAGRPVPTPLAGDWLPASGYAAGVELARRRAAGEEITAVFASNDQMALGLLGALHDAGLSVPGDVSVVGFDDIPESAFFAPPLTTVRQDFVELGRRGVALALGRLDDGDEAPGPVLPTLVARQSTGPPPA